MQIQSLAPNSNISLVDGYIRIERPDFEPYNEAEDFLPRSGRDIGRAMDGIPHESLADKLYRNRQTLAYCKERGIRLTGPALGKTTQEIEH